MVLTAVCLAVALLSLPLVLRMKRIRDQREMEQHSITAEELHSLLTSNQDVLLLDVRQPLDLLAYSEIIPGAHWISPKEVLEKPSLIPKEKEAIVYCTCAGEKTSRAGFTSSSQHAFFPDQVPQRRIGGLEGEGLSSGAIPRGLSPLHSKRCSALRVERSTIALMSW